jgi:predicted nucleic acid-binding protein
MRIRATLDSNILVYAALEPDSFKGEVAADLIRRAAPHGILAVQALLEFVAVVRRRAPSLTAKAVRQAEAWAAVFETAPSTLLVMGAALRLVDAHRFQVWDAVIICAARAAGATVFFSEDLQDDLSLDGLRVVNPFARGGVALAAMLDPKRG